MVDLRILCFAYAGVSAPFGLASGLCVELVWLRACLAVMGLVWLRGLLSVGGFCCLLCVCYLVF